MKRITSMLLIAAIILSICVLPASAATSDVPLTEYFVNDEGEEIATSQKSTTEVKSAPEISGYTYSSQSAETTHIYTKNHITYVIGYPDGSVRAENSITRSEAITILFRLYDGVYPAFTRRMSNDTFADVDSGAWYYKELETLYNTGVANGYGDEFKPNEPITRAEFAVLCARYDGLKYVDEAKFADVPVGHWAYSYINSATAAGWVKGYPDGTFRPDDNIKRVEVMALLNRLFNRTPALDELPEGINPYNDLTTGHWGYPDVMEATVKHDSLDWHGASYNDGKYNIVTEKFVDTEGNEIAKPVATESKLNYHPLEIARHSYVGYITEITYVYSSGAPVPGITKTASIDKASVGDTITYSITLENGTDATDAWRDVVLADEIPEHLDFVHGSVYLDGDHTEYSFKNGVLTVPVGNIEIGGSVAVKFDVTVASTAYGESIANTATGNGSNGGPVTARDEGITVSQGEIEPWLTKSTDVDTAVVGQTITYTLAVGNGESADYAWENAVITDKIPEGLSFVDGSVYLGGTTKAYTYKNGVLSIEMGDIEPGDSYEITFKAKVLDSAYGTIIYNTAVGTGDNTPDVTAPDDGVEIADGEAIPSATKSTSVSTAKVGDTIIYTIEALNGKDATAAWLGATITDVLPELVSFKYGSVQVNGESAQYSYKSSSRELTIKLGDIQPRETVTASFAVTVNFNAYGQTIKNTAILSGGNIENFEVSDEGISIAKGVARMSATKAVDKSIAKVGDTLTYTITASNELAATVNLENVVMADVLSEYVTFSFGSVQVDGYSAKYSYDNESRQLLVELGDIASWQTKTITFSCVVNSAAYGKEFSNTVVLSADNDSDKSATDKGVSIADGTAEGSVGTKTVSSPTAKVGDTLTYTITLRNASTATADWTGIEITDVIPEYLSFISGSVEEDGRASANASYNAGSKALTLFADSIGIGEAKIFTFKATVQDGAQGKYIVNTAVVSSDDRENIQLPDTGVQIDGGSTVPYMTKTASVSEAHAGDIFSYTITVKNGVDATAPWKNLILSDVLPTGVKLVSGSVTLNGQTVAYGISGQAIEVTVGDLSPGEDAVVTFDVRVLDSAVGTTVENTVIARGDNGQKTATDKGVTVPNPDEGKTPSDPDDSTNKVTGAKTVDKTLVNAGDKVTYTITAANNTDDTWTGVQVYDVLDTSMLTLIDDSIYIDGVRFLSGSGKWTFTDKQLVINLGDIEAGKEAVVKFTVQFKNDAANSSYTNHATIKSTNNDSVFVKAPEVTIMPGGGEDFLSYTNIHYKLFIGCDDGEWKPNTNMRLDHMCILAYRLMTDYYRSTLGNGTITVPDTITDREVQFFISHGVVSAAEFENGGDVDVTQSQVYRLLNYAIGGNLSSNSSSAMSRASVASLVCDLTGRDKAPQKNGLTVTYFPDKGSYVGLIDEVSNSHDYTLDSSGNETWISILKD